MCDNKLWRPGRRGIYKLCIPAYQRVPILYQAHDRLGHRGIYATTQAIAQRMWWPGLASDVAWYVHTCHLCQVQQKRQVLIPPTVALPAPLFWRVHIDTMYMPPSGGFHLFVQARCATSTWVEGRSLRRETAQTLGNWLFEDILSRWGMIGEIVTDNGSAFVKALGYLEKRYHISHIRISGYNSRANGIVEHAHFDVRQTLFKAADGDQSRWSRVVFSVLWSERVTVRKRLGCSPYFAVTGTHPLLPLDIAEATYLVPPPDALVTTEDLIANRAITLQKRAEDLARLRSRVYEARVAAARRFEAEHAATIRDFDFKRGDLVLMRNTAVEKALNRKMRPRYLGPLVVIARNRGGAYLLCELDGTAFDRPVAAFRVIPYFARVAIPLPDNFPDLTADRLRDLLASDSQGDDDEVSLDQLVTSLIS